MNISEKFNLWQENSFSFLSFNYSAIAYLIGNVIRTITGHTKKYSCVFRGASIRTMVPRKIYCRYVFFTIIVFIGYSRVSCKEYFTAAVFEHAHQRHNVSSTAAQKNLEYYKKAAQVAKEEGADLIVFPEYGILPPSDRNKTKGHLEIIPNPREMKANPCDKAESYSTRPILYALSCLAKDNGIVVVANMAGAEPCDGKRGCPEDGTLHLNTNVVFDSDGTLLARYSKERLFFEIGMDLPLEKQNPFFETEFGKFAMFISFDIFFRKMADVSRFPDVDAVLFPNMWVNIFPFYSSTQFFQSWAMGNNATLLAANLQIPGYFAIGSGIYRGRDGSIDSIFNPDGIPKLIVATIPKRNRKISSVSKVIAITESDITEWKDDGKDIPTVCAYHILGESKNIEKEYRCINEKTVNYTFVKLHGAENNLEVCNNGMCCAVDYTADTMDESFYLGVFNGTHNSFDRYFWAEENCFLARCDDHNGTVCSHFPMHSNTVFREISLTSNFTTKYIYPSLVSSGMRLVPVKDWTYRVKSHRKATIEYGGNLGIQLLVASLNGRPYKRDPPYIR